MMDRSWYLIYTKPRCEHKARQNLREQGFTVYLPLYETKRPVREKPLFPNYLFINLHEKSDNWAPIRSTPGVSKLVRFGQQPAKVPDSLVQLLQQNENNLGYQVMKRPLFQPGEKVRVLEGPLAGLEAAFGMTKGSERAMVLLDIVGKMTRVEVHTDQLERA